MRATARRRSRTSRQGYRHRDSGAMKRSGMPIRLDHRRRSSIRLDHRRRSSIRLDHWAGWIAVPFAHCCTAFRMAGRRLRWTIVSKTAEYPSEQGWTETVDDCGDDYDRRLLCAIVIRKRRPVLISTRQVAAIVYRNNCKSENRSTRTATLLCQGSGVAGANG